MTADEQRPTPALTEGDLASIEDTWDRHGLLVRSAVPRLIAALRAARTHHEGSELQLRQWQDRTARAEAEVERLRAELADSDAWHSQFEEAVTTYKAAWSDPAAAIPTINAINALVNAYEDLNQRD